MKTIVKKVSLLVAALSLSMSLFAEESSLVVSKDYDVIGPKTVEEPIVEEFFNYACGGCYGMEKFVDGLAEKHPNLKVKAIPVELRPAWKIYVKAYYLGEKLGVLAQSHPKIFHRIHVEKKFFNGEDDMKAFFLSLGVDAKAYDDVANSYWISTQMRLAKQYAFKSKVVGTPTFVVNKRYKLNNSNLGTLERIESAIVELSGVNTVKQVAEKPGL